MSDDTVSSMLLFYAIAASMFLGFAFGIHFQRRVDQMLDRLSKRIHRALFVTESVLLRGTSTCLPVPLPRYGLPVLAVLRHTSTGNLQYGQILKSVDESDQNWRFVEDNSELSYDWDVIYWEYTDK